MLVALLSSQRDNFDLWSKLAKNALLMQGIFVISLRTMNCPYGHELAYAMNCTIVHELPTALRKQGNSIHEIEDFKS